MKRGRRSRRRPRSVRVVVRTGALRKGHRRVTSYDRLCAAKAAAQEFENDVQRGLYFSKEEIEAERSETAQIIQNDLGALGKRLAMPLSGKAMKPEQITRIIDAEIRSMVLRWTTSRNIKETAVPT